MYSVEGYKMQNRQDRAKECWAMRRVQGNTDDWAILTTDEEKNTQMYVKKMQFLRGGHYCNLSMDKRAMNYEP